MASAYVCVGDSYIGSMTRSQPYLAICCQLSVERTSRKLSFLQVRIPCMLLMLLTIAIIPNFAE